MSKSSEFLCRYIPLVEGLQKYLGDLYEIILHDVHRPDSSILYIAGNLTHRSVGGPLTNVVLEELKRHGDQAEDMIGYQSSGPQGQLFKSATIFLRDDSGSVMGCFCINMNISALQPSVQWLCSMLSPGSASNREVFAQDITEVVDHIVEDEIAATGIPLEQMTRADRTAFILALDKKGIFDVKGAVERIAHLLNTSIYTIYSYLKEIRSEEDASSSGKE